MIGPVTLRTRIEDVPGITEAVAAGLRELGLTNVGRLIAHLPMRHEKLEAEAAIGQLTPGQIVSARGEITATRVVGRGRRPRFEAVMLDHTGRLDLVWFNQPYLRQQIMPGTRLRVQGKAKMMMGGLQLANPKFHILKDEAEPEPDTERIRPVYPASEKLPSRQIERAIQRVLVPAMEQIEDHLPEAYRRKRALPELREAYRMMHDPREETDFDQARRRLAFDELLLLQLGLQMKRAHLRRALKAPALKWSEPIDSHIRQRLPFGLTPSQDKVIEEIVADLTRDVPTNRLVQGDVGSGKTVVALYAMLMAVASGHQGALMAPTEILAEQHYGSVRGLLRDSRVRVELLTGATPKADRESILARLGAGEVDILIGTHALLTETVRFHSLAVAVIDEQHRFGVHQRARLRLKGSGGGSDAATPRRGDSEAIRTATDKERLPDRPESAHAAQSITPHVLVMTATPIPRTMAITLFGDLDVSTIDALPPGRRPVKTRLVGPEKRDEVYAWLRTRIDEGEQGYVVVPAIDTGAGELHDVRTVHARLEGGELAGRRVSVLHGRLKRATREHVMERFRGGTIDVLVATTVIEVGVDVPNAGIMVIEHAERFGLAQLHQLRGRVGRGQRRSYCILIGEAGTPESEQRLKAVAATTDGFALAERDMELRGPGEVFGTRQAGLAALKVADLRRDTRLLRLARDDAREWIENSPPPYTLDRPEEKLLKSRLMKLYGDSLGLGDVG